MITDKEADVLSHASSNGRYVTGDKAVLAMAETGLLYDHGAQRLAGGDHYLVMTPRGREALNEWRAAQPKLKPTRRRSEQFQAWRSYCEACRRIPFSEFLKEIWPNRNHYV
jgi:hypothetical protein